jgi:hypothetical protein
MQKSLRSAVDPSHIEPNDDFFAAKKEQFLQNLQEKGHDFFTCKDFIETKGLVSLNQDLLVANMGNLNYVNPLKVQPQVYPPTMQVNYGYNPNLGQA